ncbi:MAG: undecaprenyl-diphosphate phosphatase [Acutalibacteraceae bacterium]
MEYIYSVIMGIVQGLTEFLPVSSSGHLTMVQHIFGIDGESNFFFNVMLHLGTLVAVFAFYYKLIFRLVKEFFLMIKDIFTGKFSFKNMNDDRNMIIMIVISLLPILLLFMPVPGTDLSFKDFSEIFTANKYLIAVAICLLITSSLLWIGIFCNNRTVKRKVKGRENGKTRYNVLDALIVGVTQAFATLPGISRSGSTLAVAEMRGINKQKALDYTFVLGIPTILGSAVLELKDALETPVPASEEMSVLAIVIGMIVSAIVGYLAIVIFKWFLKTDKMYIFAIYTALIGIVALVISIIEMNVGFNIFSGEMIF